MDNQEVTIKSTAVRFTNHVRRQKYAYLFAGAAVLLLRGSISNMRHYDAFLKTKGIDPLEFWNPEFYAEKMKSV